MTTYQLEIDGSGAEQGSAKIVKSFEDIKAAANRMEGGVTAAAQKASRSFASLQSAAKPVSQAAIDSLRQLSAVLSKFKAPSDAAVRNTIIFLQGIKSVGALNLGRVSGLAGILSAISGFRGPTATSGKNTLSLLNALRFASSYSSPRGLAQTLTALSAFRGPTAAAARNVHALLNSLATFRAPPGLLATARALDLITTAANRATGSLRNLKGISVGATNIRVNTSNAASGIAALTKQHNLLHSALLKTQTLYNSLGGILAGRAIIGASNDIIKIRAQLEAATGSAQQARVQFLFLKDQTEKLGLEFQSTARSFGFFLGAIKGTNLTFKEAQDIFRGFTTAARALQLSTSDVDGIFRALGQIMSKGKLQAEELRQQLGDRLPGAFVRFARALDMTRPGQLDKALKDGAISGDKLRIAIIKVAQSMEVEFSKGAKAMSQTVDAAFNRLKNSFTFAAADLGKSGLNEAIINLFDTLRKFLQSEGFNNSMKLLGAAFKILGENIEVVAHILGFLAVNAMLKWVASWQLLAKAVSFFTGLRAAAAIGSFAMAMTGAAASTGVLTRAMALLAAVIRANPIFFLTAIIIGVTIAFNKLTDTMTEQKEAMNTLNGKMADAENYFEAFTAGQLDIARNMGDTTNEIYKQIHALNQLALIGSTQGIEGYKPTYGNPVSAFLGGTPNGVQGPGGVLNPQQQALLARYVRRQGSQYVIRDVSGGATTPDEKGFRQLSTAGSVLQFASQGPGGEAYRPAYEALKGRVNALIAQSREMGYKGINYEALATKYGGDYNRSAGPGGGISGDPLEKAKKGGGGKSEGEKWADELERALRQAEKAMSDLQTEAQSASSVIESLLGGSLDTFGAAALQAAQAQEKTFEDTFQSAEKAQRGVLALAAQLQQAGKIGADQDISTYERAKSVVIEYMESLQNLAAQKKRDAEVAGTVADMQSSNDIQEQAIELLRTKGTTQADYNQTLEIENALLGTSRENRAELLEGLTKEIERRDALQRQLEQTNALRELENQKTLNANMRPLYAAGTVPEDLAYYKEMFEYRQKLIDQNYSGQQLRDSVAIHAATLNEARAMKEVEDQYERTRQVAIDMADAIVGGFKEGVESGKSFLGIMKDIFKDLKNTILDFVLYNPLRQFLANALQGGMSSGGAQGGSTSYSPGGGGSFGTLMSSGGGLLGSLMGGGGYGGGASGGAMTGVQRQAATQVGETIGDSVVDAYGTIVVRGGASGGPRDVNAPISSPQRANTFFQGIEKIFNYKANGAAIKNLATALKSGKGISGAVGGAIEAGGQALAAYSMGSQIGKSVAKALGGGFRTQAVAGGALGGAAAGYSLGGPVGAAIGAVVGGVLGFLKKKPKIPSSYGSVVVGDDGIAVVGKVGKYGSGTKKAGRQAATGAAKMFNDFALDLDAQLQPGKYGTFGHRKFSEKGGDEAFYSLTGRVSKGKPKGQKGVDWIKGTDSQVQAWALIQQVKKGMITGLSDTMKTVFANTKASDMEALTADINVGKAFDEFIKGSFRLTDVAKNVRDLNEAWRKLSMQAKALGLDESKLVVARDRMLKQMKDDFNYQIQQGILSFENPAMAAYNDLVKEYKETVESAMAVGGDLVAVEKYYGLKRADLLKQMMEEANNGIIAIARDLLTSLTASSNSPLNAGTVLANAKDLFKGLQTEISGGNYSNVDKLSTYASNYLDAAREVGGSSSSYFDVFTEVTDFLKSVSEINSGGAGGTGTTVPDLPDMDAIVAEITAKNAELVAATSSVGEAVVEGSTQVVDAIDEMGASVVDRLNLLLEAWVGTSGGTSGGGSGVPLTGTISGGTTYGGGNLRTIGESVDLV